VNSETLLKAIKQHGQRRASYHQSLTTLPEYLFDIAEEGDLVLTLGAGNIVQVGEQLLDMLDRA
jgi:UDP-N-acetylmuramate--alanine ligase